MFVLNTICSVIVSGISKWQMASTHYIMTPIERCLTKNISPQGKTSIIGNHPSSLDNIRDTDRFKIALVRTIEYYCYLPLSLECATYSDIDAYLPNFMIVWC